MKKIIFKHLGVSCILLGMAACTPDLLVTKSENKAVPDSFNLSQDSTNSTSLNWREYFSDPDLVALIDLALENNQELNIVLQEVEMARNEVQAKRGEYLPSVSVGAEVGVDKVGRYTRNGAVEHNLEIMDDAEFPEPLPDFMIGARATWEVDIWKQLRTAKKAAFTRYMSSIEGKNFLVTNLISEIVNSYYELLALDNVLLNVEQNITLQSNALEMVKVQKQAARVTELAVKRFQAQLLSTQSLQFEIRQEIVETENRLNFLVGRFPQPIPRDPDVFNSQSFNDIQSGIPSQLLENRSDIRQAELDLVASKLDVKVAKKLFYPSLGISAGIGYHAFNPKYLLDTPESMLYYMGGDLVAPLINRKAIKTTYFNANRAQIQAVYNYERAILNAYIEVANELANIENMEGSYQLKAQEVQALNESIDISNSLFRAARAEYIEVLLTQEEALESRFELIETRMNQMHAWVNVYRALGGGWE